MIEAFEKASAVITEEGGLTSHAAIVGLSLGIPVVVGVDRATDQFEDGEEITIDATRGNIYKGHASIL
jgi:pyruvate kinase